MKCHSCLTLGVRLHYEVYGNGPMQLVLLHGFAASSVTWEELCPLFPPGNYTIYLVDLKGFGKSGKPRDSSYRLEDQASLVLDLLQALTLSNVTLVGHSLGGGIALLAWHNAKATGRSSLIGRLILIDAAAYRQPLPRFFEMLRRPIIGWLILKTFPVRKMVRYNLERVYYDSSQVTEKRISRYVSCFRGSDTIYALITTARQVDASTNLPDNRDVTVPTLIIWGRHDRIIRLRNGDRLHDEIPGSRLVVLECGHNPHEEESGRCADAIREFLEEI